MPRLQAVVEEGDKAGFAGVISPKRVGTNGGKDVSLDLVVEPGVCMSFRSNMSSAITVHATNLQESISNN
jgi:hypothetical protein